MTRSLVCRWRLFLVAAGTIVACTGAQDAPRIPLAQISVADSARAVEGAHTLIAPAVKMALDSGNALFRKKAYAAALVQYRAASTLAPRHAAPLFGIYMVGRAINDSALADSALVGIRLRNGPMTPAPHTISDSVMQRVHETLRKKSTS